MVVRVRLIASVKVKKVQHKVYELLRAFEHRSDADAYKEIRWRIELRTIKLRTFAIN